MAKAKVVAGIMVAGMLLGGSVTFYVEALHAQVVQKQVQNVPATGPVDFGPTTLRWEERRLRPNESIVPIGKPQPRPEPKELVKRYRWIFNQLDERYDGDEQIRESSASFGGKNTRPNLQRLVEMQATITATIWNHMEAAVKEVAQKHGESIAALDDATPMPDNPAEVGATQVQLAIQDRTVIPLSDDMAREVLALANARYAQSKPPASQP